MRDTPKIKNGADSVHLSLFEYFTQLCVTFQDRLTYAKVGNSYKKVDMSASKIAVYATNELGPANIDRVSDATKKAGWTTITLGLFHVGYPPKWAEADIFFNDPPPIVHNGSYRADPAWPEKIAQLKQNSPVTQIYASIGGGDPVEDFSTIKTIYEKNNNSFDRTMLKKNLQVFRKTFPAIDGIDMDCEESYDQPSFVAFCKMVIGMGFAITFCPFERTKFWVGSLKELEESNNERSNKGAVKYKGVVKWWNLQCYAGGSGNDPKRWANAIKKQIPKFSTAGFILASDWARFYDEDDGVWLGDCPAAVKQLISGYSKEACFGGAFIWNMDAIIKTERDPRLQCCGKASMADYAQAIRETMQPVAPS